MQIGFLLFPDVTQLDFTGPLQVLHRLPGGVTHIAAKTRDPVPSDCGLSLVPTTTFAECPLLDVLCVPGGFGVDAAMADAETMAFVRRMGGRARYVTSVCTGAFILGAAGLLRGKRATTHWAYHDLLPLVGAIPERARVVRDGDTFTGGGVTAGIDFALTLAGEIAGDAVAQSIQLAIEYDPAPPFDAGDPDRAPEAVRTPIAKRYGARHEAFKAALAAAK
ncbi:MAG: DJ-1/PfpI family protein [Hyphomonadaceae bacterium]|nr:DJ-1/PfpI family protein [Hyphomonadaceae bacterium]